nr:ribosome biogenesis GTPase Der [Planctomycetota bacterium]
PGDAAAEAAPAVRPPVIAIVGRPNVGKSTLLNSLVRSRIAIVEDTPGVTRDRVGVLTTLCERTVEIVDTGGVGIVDRQGLDEDVESQVAAAVGSADVILFVVDAREGRAPLDERVAHLLRPEAARVILVANKAETDRVQWNVAEFQGLGYGEPLLISAKEKQNLDELEERIEPLLPEGPTTPVRMAAPDLKLSVVGRVNAGKSTFVNAMLEADRMIVSEVPGTTRDSVDIRFERDGESCVIIDTAGIRKERAVHGSVEFYAQRRAEKAMRRADVTVLMLDASVDVGRLDRQIAGYAAKHYVPIVVVANKWDLCEEAGITTDEFSKYLDQVLSGLPYAPVVYTSALEGKNVEKVLEVARNLHKQASTRVSTAEINKVVEAAYAMRKPRPRQGRIGRIYYASQVEVCPPTITLFVNDTYLFRPDYLRFMANRFREALPMPEVPIRVFLKPRERSPSKNLKGPR